MAPGTKTNTKPKRAGGRRANYAPLAHTVGTRKYLPLGWIMWTGWIMFGLLALVMVIEIFASAQAGHYVDIIGGMIMTGLFSWMFWLFGTSRLKDL